MFTLHELLAHYSPETDRDVRTASTLAEAVLAIPIVAVAGLNDQGKSSLVASFLSPAGSARVLRGTRGREATYRFTLWLPASWEKDEALRTPLDKALAEVFGCAPELLPTDVTGALASQNADRDLAVPMIAWDPRLDGLKIGLLDCPDVQKRPVGADEHSADRRTELLRRASELCSSTILIAKHQNVTTTPFATILSTFSGKSPVYAFNQVRELPPEELLVEVRTALKLPPSEQCYAAYDYDLRFYEDRTPMWDPNRHLPKNTPERFPCFFRLSDIKEENLPDRIDETRSLHHLARSLDREELLGTFQKAKRRELRSAGLQALALIETEVAGQESRIQKARDQVREACDGALQREDGKGFLFNAEMANSLAKSIISCAPGYLRLQLKAKAAIGAFIGHVRGIPERLAPEIVTRFGTVFSFLKRATLDRFLKARSVRSTTEEPLPEILARLLLNRWRSAGFDVTEDEVRAAAARIDNRFRTVGLNNLSEEEWNTVARKLWQQAPKGKMGLKMALEFLGLLGMLAWVLTEPASGQFAWTHWYIHSVAWGHAAGGAGLAAFGLGGTTMAILMQSELQTRLGPGQRNRFFDIACDELGLPRIRTDSALDHLALPTEVNFDGLCLKRFGMRLDKLHPAAVYQLRTHLEQIPL